MSDNNRNELPTCSQSSELTELLRRLEISPLLLNDEDAPTTNRRSSSDSSIVTTDIRKADELDGYPEISSSSDVLDREVTLKQLVVVREDGKMIKWENELFHEHLIEHFKRKQMTHVYNDEPDNFALIKKYSRKLAELERLREEIQASQEEQEAEVKCYQKELKLKTAEANKNVESMISRERAVGLTTYRNGKSLSMKDVQNLISKQISKMKEMAKFRFRYARLRDDLISKETILNTLKMLNPNLGKEDYRRLEDEKFYYEHELSKLENEIKNFEEKREKLKLKINSTVKAEKKVRLQILNEKKISDSLKNDIKRAFQKKKISLRKLQFLKKFIFKLTNASGVVAHPEITSELAIVRKEHENLIKKITIIMNDIKQIRESLSVMRASLIVRDKKEEKNQDSNEDDNEDDDDNNYVRQKSNLPPVAGGFYLPLRIT
ncbi:ELKS/Rab6-interacting/CAST family member 1 [Cephus cinctus]|uniref:ELKS/Rab6-interacting/CAST family member 1 n=1 Tax=Cephus cinctus TaxID=211228 RepID=A0AAJ7CBV9_CEPCN|nr:ELKS/Rab6-interacting/CAST family member 1 [Cephus cinctus]